MSGRFVSIFQFRLPFPSPHPSFSSFLRFAGLLSFFFSAQVLTLGARGYRVIAVQYPPYWSHLAWAKGFADFLKRMGIQKVNGALGQVFLALDGLIEFVSL
mgnify:CR=1 FL=1